MACTGDEKTARHLQLVWGVEPIIIPVITSTEELIFTSVIECYNLGFLTETDQLLVVAGTILGVPSKTNQLQVLKVADILALRTKFE